jgi:hypothetical protein
MDSKRSNTVFSIGAFLLMVIVVFMIERMIYG